VAELRVTEQERRRIAVALGTTVDSEDFDDRVRELEQVALDELVDWILSRRRFESAAALDRHRVLAIYGAIRHQAPSVESLANDLDISESRAMSLVSRMRYGDARMIRRLTYEAAAREITDALALAQVRNGRKEIPVTAETGRVVDEANTAILLDQEARRPGGRYEGAEKAERLSATRTGQEWVVSEQTWTYIADWIQERIDQLAL
jgi:hypothetical protein